MNFNWLPTFGKKSSGAEATAKDPLAAFLEVFRQSLQAKTGTSVNLDSALQVSVLFACLRVLGEGTAQVPFELCQEVDSPNSELINDRRRATDHKLFPVLARRPNSWQTSFEFRETLTWHAGLLGGAYVFINRVGLTRRSMRVAELIPMNPMNLSEVRQKADYSLEYGFRGKDGAIKWYPQESIWHLRGPSWDGINGLRILRLAKETLGLAIATEESHAKLHSQGVMPSGIYTVDGKLEPKQYEDLKAWVTKEYAGTDNKGKPMILDMNAKFVPNVMTGVDSQHLETRRHQIEEVCRWFRMMPIMIGYSDKTATYASAEAMILAHLTHCLMPWYARIEQSADAALLSEDDMSGGYYTKFRERALLRGAMKDHAEYLTKLKNAGIISANEARWELDRNPVEGGDKLAVSSSPAPAPQGNEDPSATPKE